MFTLIRFAIRTMILTACVNAVAVAVIAANWNSIRDWASAKLQDPPASWIKFAKHHAIQLQIPDVPELKAMLPEGLKGQIITRDLAGK